MSFDQLQKKGLDNQEYMITSCIYSFSNKVTQQGNYSITVQRKACMASMFKTFKTYILQVRTNPKHTYKAYKIRKHPNMQGKRNGKKVEVSSPACNDKKTQMTKGVTYKFILTWFT